MLKLENVKKLYSNNRGLRNTTIEFQEGEITGILGRNGSGKTTLLKGILNLLPLDDGIITWNDKSVEEQFDKVAFITEDGSYFPICLQRNTEIFYLCIILLSPKNAILNYSSNLR